LASVFAGLVLGVFIGSWPLDIPGLPAAVKLGLAGGPMLTAILLSRMGQFKGMVFHMPRGASFMLRELGMAMFLACVGLRSGDGFFATLTQGDGLYWMACAALITFIPIMLVGLFGRIVRKLDYVTLTGLLAGSMTDPPALAFANSSANSDAPAISYATVYPLVMIMRVLLMQVLIQVLMQ